jgi:5'-nucleotidase / UDP-sugar diphosphatase
MAALRRWSILVLLCFAAFANAEEIRITILHVNDLYEITPISGGKEGGMARFATLRAQLLRRNRNTFTVLAGDFLSPSVLGTALYNGQPIAGAQMVSMLNAVGVDYATFGNHEFDVTEQQLQARIRESRFLWFSGNVRNGTGEPFPGVRQNVVLTVEGEHGGHVRIGLIGLTLDETKKPWVQYKDVLQAARDQVTNLRSQGVDVVIAVTHETFVEDKALAEQVPGIDMIIGGHEHENIKAFRGPNFTPILKADANLRSAYVHDLVYDTERHSLEIDSRLARITDAIPENEAVAKLANDWTERAFAAFRKTGFEPNQVIATTNETLQGKESAVRHHATNLTDLIAAAFLHGVPNAEASIFNSGSIRIDDDLPPGPIRQYDVLRVLPFGGNMVLAEMKGTLLTKVLDIGQSNSGSGGYLQTANISRSPQGTWQINGQPIDPNRTYRIATSAFLLTGGEKNLDFLTRANPDVVRVTDGKDQRFALIQEFQNRWPVGGTQKAMLSIAK